MTEKTAVPEYCRGGKKIRAYQCGICDRLDVDDVSDKRFCRAGYWRPRRLPGSIQTDIRPRAHRRSPLKCPIRTERGYLWEDLI